MKRDIKINIQELEKIRSKIQTYIGYLEQLESASNTFLETIKAQDSQAYEKLSGMWEEDISDGEKLLKERFDTIDRVLGNYICDMESYIAPKDPAVIMRVDRDDINWNYNQIVEHTKSIWDILMDTGSSWADYQKVFFYNPFEDGETNEARKRAVEAEVSAERERRERNYEKLEEFRNRLLKVSTENISEHVAAIHAVYNDKVIPFEDRDDHYKKVMDGHYDDWKSFGDGLWDIGVVVGNAFEGVFGTVVETLVGIKDLLVGLGEICLWGLLQSMTVDVPGVVPEWLDEDVSAIGNGVTGILKDPGNALEAMGQDMFDMVDEKGIAYSVGYVATDLIIGKVIDKNLV